MTALQSSLFDGPLQMVARGREHAEELKRATKEYGDSAEVGFVLEEIGETMDTWVIRFRSKPPTRLPIILKDAIHSLRVAMDILVCDSALLLNMPMENLPQVKFPFAKDVDALESALRRMRLPHDLEKTIKGFHPVYPHLSQINKWMRDLHDLDIESKHRTIIPVYSVARTTLGPIQNLGPLRDEIVAALGFDLLSMTVPWHEGSTVLMAKGWDPLINIGSEPQIGVSIPAGLPFADEDIPRLLERLANAVEGVIKVFALVFAGEGDPEDRAKVREALEL